MKASLLTAILCFGFSVAQANMTEIRCSGTIKNSTGELQIDKTVNISDFSIPSKPQKIAGLGETEISVQFMDSSAIGPFDLIALIATTTEAHKSTKITSTTIAIESNILFLTKVSEQAESFNAFCEIK